MSLRCQRLKLACTFATLYGGGSGVVIVYDMAIPLRLGRKFRRGWAAQIIASYSRFCRALAKAWVLKSNLVIELSNRAHPAVPDPRPGCRAERKALCRVRARTYPLRFDEAMAPDARDAPVMRRLRICQANKAQQIILYSL